MPQKAKTHIYYTVLNDMDGNVKDQRVSFAYQQYWALVSAYGEEYVTCKRMGLDSGIWEPYPEQE